MNLVAGFQLGPVPACAKKRHGCFKAHFPPPHAVLMDKRRTRRTVACVDAGNVFAESACGASVGAGCVFCDVGGVAGASPGIPKRWTRLDALLDS